MGYSYLNDQSTFSGDAVLTSTYADDAIVQGYGYIVETTFPLGASATAYIEVNPTAMVNQRLTVQPTQWGITASNIEVTLGVANAFSGGTAITFINKNYAFSTSRPAKTICKINATPTTPIDSQIKFMVGTTVSGAVRGGGNFEGGGIQILNPILIYYFKVVNQTSTAGVVSMSLQIFETPVDPAHGF